MKIKYQIDFIYAISFILAACSIIYEFLLAQTISFLVANMVVWYSLTIGFYLLAMGIGALCCNKLYGHKQSWLSLFEVEVLLSMVGGISVMVVHFAHMLFGYMWFWDIGGSVAIFFLLYFLMVIGVGFLSGLELPLLIRIGKEVSVNKKITNRILAADYFGSLIGSVLFPLVGLPYFELLTISFVVATLNLLIAVFMLLVFVKNERKLSMRLGGASIFLAILIFALIYIQDIQQYLLKKYYYYFRSTESAGAIFAPVNDLSNIERFSSPYQKIDIVRFPTLKNSLAPYIINAYSTKYQEDPNYPHRYGLYLNGDFQVQAEFDEVYHEYFAHIPIILNGSIPQKVLVLGAGDGLLIKELVKYTEIKSITLVELDQKVIDLVRTHPVLHYMSKGSLEDPRVNITIADAYPYIRESQEKFDAIYMDFPDPNDYNLAKLYSREFYYFIKKHLNENGYAVFDAEEINLFTQRSKENTLKMDPQNSWMTNYHTLKAAGFGTIIPYVSILETDNARALKIVSRKILEKFVTGPKQGQGFIMVKKEPGNPVFEYRDLKIKLHVLNEQRFKLALSLPYPYPERLDTEKINSIMRPTFPSRTNSFWIKLPY